MQARSHPLSFAKYTQHFPKYSTVVFLYKASSPPSRENRWRDISYCIGQGWQEWRGGGWQTRTSFFVGPGVEWRTDGRVKFAWRLVCVSNFTHAHIQQPREQFGQSAWEGRRGAADNKRRRFRHKSRPWIPARIFASERKKKGRIGGGRARGVGPSTTAKLIRQA